MLEVFGERRTAKLLALGDQVVDIAGNLLGLRDGTGFDVLGHRVPQRVQPPETIQTVFQRRPSTQRSGDLSTVLMK